jgi:hypothetical protein
MSNEKPSDFDWVAARLECSAAKVFELLYLETLRSVEARNATLPEGQTRFETANGDGVFSVVRRHRFTGVAGVRFFLVGDEISVESQGVNVQFTASLTLNDEGECRLMVDGRTLDRWQVLRRALESLFFGQFR